MTPASPRARSTRRCGTRFPRRRRRRSFRPPPRARLRARCSARTGPPLSSRTRQGRGAVLGLLPFSAYILLFLLLPTAIALGTGFFDADEAVIDHRKASTPREDRGAFIAILSECIREADAKYGQSQDIGISLAGGIDPKTGAVISANIPAIKDWPLAVELSNILGRKVLVENDADCFALAEARLGAGQGSRTVCLKQLHLRRM